MEETQKSGKENLMVGEAQKWEQNLIGEGGTKVEKKFS
jgi:hypothetical protein